MLALGARIERPWDFGPFTVILFYSNFYLRNMKILNETNRICMMHISTSTALGTQESLLCLKYSCHVICITITIILAVFMHDPPSDVYIPFYRKITLQRAQSVTVNILLKLY